MVPKVVLMRYGLVSLTTARPVNTAQPKTTVNNARQMTNVFNKAHSTIRRPINNKTTFKKSNFNQRVNTVKDKNVNTARPKAVVNTARLKVVLNAVKGNQIQVSDGLGPQKRLIFLPYVQGNLHQDLEEKGDMLPLEVTLKEGKSQAEVQSKLLTDESHVLLKVPRKNNMYSVDLNNIVPKGGLTCLFAKATSDESKLWHRRLGHINFKTMNKLVKGNLDETSDILKSFITGVENLIDQRVKVIRCDNETEFKNKEMNQFCERKGIKREFSVARTPQQNRVAERKNRTLIEAARTMLAESKLPTTFGMKQLILLAMCKIGRPNWLFDIDALTKSINYKPVITGNQSNGNAGTKVCDDAGKASMVTVPGKDYILLPLWSADPLFSQSLKSSRDAGFKPSGDDEKKVTEEPGKEGGDSSKCSECSDQEKDDNVNKTNNVNTASDGNITNNVNVASLTVNDADIKVNVVGTKTSIELLDDPNMPELEDYNIFEDDEDVGAEANMNNLDEFIHVSPIITTRIHKDHPVEKIIEDLNLVPQTRRMAKNLEEHSLFSSVQQRTNHKDFQNCLFACFLSQEEPKKVIHASKDPSWIEALQDENKKDERGNVIKNKARLVAQGYTQEDGTDYDEMSSMGELTFFLGLQVKQKEDGIFISQDKYVTEILKKFSFTDVKTASTPMETQKPLLKDEDGEEVDVHLYRSMIGSLMYLTSSRPDIMFAVCACARYQVNPKVSHLHAVKRIFRYLKGQPKLGLWYPKDSPFDLVAYTDSDYAGASLDRKSTTGGCQFLGCRLISWQCKKQTVVANSTTEAEYVAASSCCGQVLWIQNQLLDYGDSNEKKLIQMIKIHTNKNVADLLTKAFDNGIGINAGDSKLMLLGINLLLLGKVNAGRHELTTAVKTVNGEVRLQALVDGKKIIETEASVRSDLQLNDEEGTNCLPNATIFEELTRMGYEKLSQKLTFYKAFFSPQWKFLIHTILQCLSAKTTACNEFSSPMASAIICLATNQKFNFSKYIFKSMVKNLENVSGKFLMYPWFVQVFLDKQLEMMQSHKRIYVTPSHTKKIFGNMKRVGKGFSGRETPLFPTMVVQAQEEMGEDEAINEEMDDSLVRDTTTATGLDAEHERVLDLENTKTAQAQEITSLKLRVKKLEKKAGSRTHKLKRLYKGRHDDIMFDMSDLIDEEVFVAEQGVPDSKKDDVAQVNTAATIVSTASTIPVSAASKTDVEITLAQALVELKSAKPITTYSTRPKAKGLVIYEQEQASTTIVSSQQPSQAKI
ncbi:uncharacterized mitochondrial protein-like protein [Tanacetum coccineum]|uniref:Uncharacterized mitochondrial protein-like protein n=1 Tax=Tanacetum coccineum TaxID=301880 RepID=A0ABQ5AQ32_9ASTR